MMRSTRAGSKDIAAHAAHPLDSSDARGSAETEVCAYVACILMPHRQGGAANLAQEEALGLCHRVSARVELLPTTATGSGALVDLGRCSSGEAQAVCAQLLTRLAQQGFLACAGVGATMTIAQLAALTAPARSVRVIALSQAEHFIQQTPIALLTRLAPLTPTRITAEVVARLQRYGLRTLGQVARMDSRDPQTLCRQFGSAAGACLAALAQGNDLRPLHPAPAPASVSARLACSAGLTPDQARAMLPRLAARLAEQLTAQERRGRDLRLRIVWESGGATQTRRRLARSLHQPREIAQALASLLTALLAPAAIMPGATPGATCDAAADAFLRAGEGAEEGAALIAALTVTLGDLSGQRSARPAPLFASPCARSAQAERLERLAVEVAEPLARRYGRPALYRLTALRPDAILPEERACLVGLVGVGSRSAAMPDHDARQDALQVEGVGSRSAETPAAHARPPQPHWW